MLKKYRNPTALLLASSALVSGPAFTQETEDSDRLNEVVITGVYIPNEKRSTSEITSVLDQEVFSSIGASDIASALTRITGLSLSQGKFVIVRGLSERYSSATLNGSPLPSPEPLRRVAPLDLFPTSVLADVVVSKTFSPEFSGEFGGGSINMKTRALPDERYFELSLSGAYDSITSGRDGLVYEGSDSDWLGVDDGLRDLPPVDVNGIPTQNFENFDTLVIDTLDQIPGNFGGRVSYGNRFDLENGNSIGIFATLGYDNDWEKRKGEDNTASIGAGNALTLLDDGYRQSTENKIALNGMFGLGYELNSDHVLQFVTLITRQSSSEARILTGIDREDRIYRQDYTEWFERDVNMFQFSGEHIFTDFNDMELDWRATYAVARRDAPYERRVNYENYEDGQGFRFQFNRPGTNNSIRFSSLDDKTTDLGFDVTYPLNIGLPFSEVKFGMAYLNKERDNEQADFRYFGSLPSELRNSRIDLIFSDPVINSGILEIRRGGTTGFPDLSSAGLEVLGAYVGFDFELSDSWRFAIGGRFEDSEQTTSIAQSTIADSRFDFAPLKENVFLPAFTATYTFADNWQFRFAASKTINRPQFRELTPTIFVNTDTDDRFVGNPYLKNSSSINVDARFEYYFAQNQFATIGLFYKDLTDPIEEFIFNGLGESNATSFLNAPSAELYGVELEFEKVWDAEEFGLSGGFWSDKSFVVRSNYTYVDSSVSADGQLPITPPSVNPSLNVAPIILPAAGLYMDGRSLQGQSDHLVNLQLGIENLNAGWEATLLWNYASERIRAVEDLSNGLPSILEQLPVSLDFVFNYDLDIDGKTYELGFKAQNLLAEGYEATQKLSGSTIIIDDYLKGTVVAFSIKRRF